MRVHGITVSAIVVLLAVANLSAQSLSVGNEVPSPNSSDVVNGTQRTCIDLASPANATGNLTSVTFYWSTTGCTNAAKIKIYRRVGNTLTLIAERGPFTPSDHYFTATLSPPVAVRQGDLIGVARVADCGNATAATPGWQDHYLSIPGEPTSFTLSQAMKINARLAVHAIGTATEYLAGVIPAVASNAGIDASFRTTLQVMGRPPGGTTPTDVKLVFHRIGVPGGSPSDVTHTFSVMPGEVLGFADILTTVGFAGAPASVDVIMAWGETMPVITSHLFNDRGAMGTDGYRQDVVDLKRDTSQIFTPGMSGYLIGPLDAVRYRCNIGIRSLEAGAEGTVTVRRPDGSSIGSKSFSYPPNTFDQKSFKDFTGVTLADNLTVQVVLSTGSAIVYSSVADNVTGDPANVLGRTYEGVL
jgi:hypothetical protein